MKRSRGRIDWELIRHGPKRMADLVLAEIARCDNIEVLEALAAGGLSGDWRRAAVAKRIKELTQKTG
ncbi:MAG TPA: hypothetical protein VNA25_09505 [Phycisphaerae bacterium]|nr:hypothetical protein [Phycisphaerae bacterium]